MLVLLFITAISMEIARELCFKQSSSRSMDGRKNKLNAGYLGGIFSGGYIWLGFLLWGIEMLAWIRILQLCPLSVAFPVMSLCYVGLPLAGKIFFAEEISLRKWLAILLIAGGVALVGISGIG